MTGGDGSERWLTRLLRLLPAEFRNKYGDAMEQLFRDQIRDAPTRSARRAVWSKAVTDVLRVAPAEHARATLHDVRIALRSMRKNALVTMVVLGTLALGIGANIAIFSVVNTIQLRPLPFEDGDRLVRIYGTRDGGPPFLSPSNPDLYDRVVEDGRFFETIVAQRFTNVNLQTDRGPERVAAIAVTAGWTQVLGIELARGRAFSPEEESSGLAAGVALVSHGFSERHLGGSERAVGERLELDLGDVTVIGVMQPGFRYPYENEIWVPMNLDRDRDGFWGLNVQARLRDGVSVTAARTELAGISERINESRPTLLNGMLLTAIPTREVLLGEDRGFVVVLLGAVGFLLLLVSVNIGNLLLARALSRQNETALRTALGASRWRQLREVLTESLSLSLAGGALGTALGLAFSELASALVPGRMANVVSGIAVDVRVIGFAVVLSVVTGLLFGAVPAVRASGAQLVDLLKQGHSAGRRTSLSAALVVVEIALALVILVGASALAGHYRELVDAELGYDASAILASVPLDDSDYEGDGDKRAQLVGEASERLQSIPGVSRVGAAVLFPSLRGNRVTEIGIEGRPVDPDAPIVWNHRLVTPDFFDALEIPMIRGRAFSDADRAAAPAVALVSEHTASRTFPGQDPIGRRVRNVRSSDADAWVTIVGVVSDVREFVDVQQTWYLPYAQHAGDPAAGQAVFTLRAAADLSELREPIRRAIHDVDPTRPVFHLESVAELHYESLAEQRLGAFLSAAFAGLGILMAAVGIAGVMAYSVSQRLRELGLRVALGAAPSDLLRQTLGSATRWTAMGIALGLGASVFLSRFLASVLPDVTAPGALDLAVVSLLLAAIALCACYVPARKAVRVDPLKALREP